MSWDSLDRAGEKGPGALFFWFFWRGIGVLMLFGCVGIVGSVFGFIANPFRQAARVVEKTIDADNVIANYEWFKQRHEDIQAIDSKITESEAAVAMFSEAAGERANWHREDREEHSRLSAVVLGLKQQRADLAAEYNARSRMVNRSIFKAGDVELPERIEL